MADGHPRKGLDFEIKVADVLETLQQRHLRRVRVHKQPRLTLHDGGEVIPDFDLQFDLTFEEGHYLIECQDRVRSTPQIAHKIRHIKNLSSRNRFIFVYPSRLPDATRKTLEADGVLVLAFEEFAAFVARLDLQLAWQERVENADTAPEFDRFFTGGRRSKGFRRPPS